MKKTIMMALALVLTLSVPTEMMAQKNSNDSVSSAAEVGKTVTVFLPGKRHISAVVTDSVGNVVVDQAEYETVIEELKANNEWRQEREKLNMEREARWGEMALQVAGVASGVSLLIVLLCLIAYFYNRHSKIKLAMHAIDSNYPLPYGILGGRVVNNYYNNTTYTSGAASMASANGANQAGAPIGENAGKAANSADIPMGIPVCGPEVRGNSLYDYDLKKFSGSITLIVVGLCFMLFAVIENIAFLACVFLLVTLLGVSRCYIEYMAQRSMMRNAAMMRNAQANAAQAQANVPQPPAQPREENPEEYQPKA